MNAITYLTRRCPRACGYCALRDTKDVGPELTEQQWHQAFEILKNLGVEFNLILGNETWLLGESLLTILSKNKVPYALYTTCPEPLFTNYKDKFFSSGIIDNLSCGVDYPIELPMQHPGRNDDSYKKSVAAWAGLAWVRQNYPDVDTQGTITIHKLNYKEVPEIITNLSNLGIFVGVNFIHYNKDGLFDFFPRASEIEPLLFTESDYPSLINVLQQILKTPGNLQNPHLLQYIIEQPEILNMNWHCGGNPYGGPTIDSDGTLRVCGYRKGTHTPKFTIFDLPEKMDDWKEAVAKDAAECPGCHWTYPIMYNHLSNKLSEHERAQIFVHHTKKGDSFVLGSNRKIT